MLSSRSHSRTCSCEERFYVWQNNSRRPAVPDMGEAQTLPTIFIQPPLVSCQDFSAGEPLPCQAGQVASADRSGLFTNIIKRLCLTIAMALTMDAFIIAPVFPQQDEVATLNARVKALYQGRKFAEVPCGWRNAP
jgi:hypothetical protein